MAKISSVPVMESTDQKMIRLLDTAVDNKIKLGKKNPVRAIVIDLAILIVGVILTIAVWWIVGTVYNSFFADSMKFPMPADVFGRLWEYLCGRTIFSFTIWDHVGASLKRWIIGFGIAAVIGLIVGFVISFNDKLYRIIMVPVNILQMIPGLAWLPVVMILFGFGDQSAIFIVGIVVIAPVVINVTNGLHNVPKVNTRVAKMSGLSWWDTFIEVLIPFSALDILTGLRVGLGSSWRMIIAAEMVVGVMEGIGFVIKNTSDNLDYIGSFAAIIVICVIGLVIDKIIFESLERRVRKSTGVGAIE